MIVSKELIRELARLICVGRFCDECPIQDECERTHADPLEDDTTMDETINLMKEIKKERSI